MANPNKPPQIASILRRNKEKLLVFLREFHNDKDGECIRQSVWDYHTLTWPCFVDADEQFNVSLT